LSRHLAIAYIVLLVYACLYPLSGWQSKGLPLFDYLFRPWPKYFMVEDFIFNIVGFLPFGLTVVPSLSERWPTWKKVLAATVAGTLLSFGVETVQCYLPTRTENNVDILANGIGALLGSLLGARWGKAMFAPGRGLARWREHYITGGMTGDTGLILILYWLLGQITPDHVLFGGGDLRRLLGIAAPLPFQVNRLIVIQTAQTASMMLAVGLFARCMLHRKGVQLAVGLLAVGVVARTLASAALFIPASPFAWLTPGVQNGLLIGAVLLFVALRMSRVAQHALAGTALLMAAVLINLMPESPYLESSGPAIIARGNYPSFHAMCRLVAALWPFAALAYLSAIGLWRGERLADRDHAGEGVPYGTNW
jgi:VanZ family protein